MWGEYSRMYRASSTHNLRWSLHQLKISVFSTKSFRVMSFPCSLLIWFFTAPCCLCMVSLFERDVVVAPMYLSLLEKSTTFFGARKFINYIGFLQMCIRLWSWFLLRHVVDHDEAGSFYRVVIYDQVQFLVFVDAPHVCQDQVTDDTFFSFVSRVHLTSVV